MSKLLLLLKKDLSIEFRTNETLVSLFALTLLLATLTAIGVHGAFIDAHSLSRMVPTLLWVPFICAATFSISRSFSYEDEFGGLEAVFLTNVSPALIFLSKFISNSIIIFAGFVLLFLSEAILLDLPIDTLTLPMISIGALVVIGYTALATLLTGPTVNARLKGVLLPLILIPLLLPIFFGAYELSMDVIIHGSYSIDSPWISLLLVLDVVYVVLGINLFEFTVRG